jgi:hypothetical protein
MSSFYDNTEDPRYDTLSRKIPRDISNAETVVKKYTPIEGRQASSSNYLGSGTLTKFDVSRPDRTMWDLLRSSLCFRYQFHDGTNSCDVDCCPSPYLFFQSIKTIKIIINHKPTPILNCVSDVLEKFVAKTIMYFDKKDIEEYSKFLCTPMHDEAYEVQATGYTMRYKSQVETSQKITSDTVIFTELTKPNLPDTDATSGLPTAYDADTVKTAIETHTDAIIELVNGINENNRLGTKSARCVRYEKYCVSKDQVTQLDCPLWFLVSSRPNGYPKNIDSIQIDLEWEDSTNLLQKSDAASDGRVFLREVFIRGVFQRVNSEFYNSKLLEKIKNDTDKFAFIDPKVSKRTIDTSVDTIINNVADLDSVMMFNLIDDTETTDTHTYSCNGFELFNTQLATPIQRNLGATKTIDTIQMVYGMPYPENALDLKNQGGTVAVEEAYEEYYKATMETYGKVFFTLEDFYNCHAFVWLKPSVRVKPSSMQNLEIKTNGLSASIDSHPVIINTIRAFSVLANGEVVMQ